MKRVIDRGRFVAGTAVAAASAGLLRTPAGAAEYNLKFATETTPLHHNTVRLNEAMKSILAESDGRVDIKVFPTGQLGGMTQILSELRLGAVDFSSSIDLVLSGLTPVGAITSTPYLFGSQQEGISVMSGPMGAYRRAAIAKQGVYPFAGSWSQGFRQVLNSVRRIDQPSDIKGLKILTAISPVEIGLFKAFGAAPVGITMNEIYVSMQTHLVDGTCAPLNLFKDVRLYEVGKYITYTNHIWTSTTMMANSAMWQKLPGNLRDIIEHNINEACAKSNADVIGMQGELETALVKGGATFNHPDMNSFKAFAQRAGIYADMKQQCGPEAWALLEKSVGRKLG